jgi:glycosyltransferase involved in cell wall biosynthesis
MRSFFEWFQDKRIDPNDPWLMLGKGPSFAKRHAYDLGSFHILSLNHAVREQPVRVAHILDYDVIDDCAEAIRNNAEVLVMPWRPHLNFVPGVNTLDELAQKNPTLQLMNEQGRLLWYNLSTAREEHGKSPVVHAEFFSAEAALNLLALAGVCKVRSLGVDGGRDYSEEFDDLKSKTLLSCGQESFDKQFKGFARTIRTTGVDYAPLNGESPVRVYVGATKAQPRPLRIAFATPIYVTEKRFDGGLAHYIHRVARAFAGLGHDVHVITVSEIDEAEFEHEGVTVHRVMVSKAWPLINRLTRYRLTTTTYQLDLSVQVYRKLKQLNARPFDLVQVPNSSYCGLVSKVFLKVPHVLRASSYLPLYNDLSGVTRKLDSRTVERLEALQFRLCENIFCPSHTLQRTLAGHAKLDRVRVIRTPFYEETSEWDHSVYDRDLKGKKYLLYFGRFDLLKGFHILAQALPGLLQQHGDAHVVLVGRDMKSALAPSMAEYARELSQSFAERLHVLDRLPHSQLYPIIAGAHLVALPSLMENFPNACLEAMALGKPVIGTIGASFEEIISDEETGFLVARNNPDELAEKFIYAWTHPRLGEIGAAARQKMQELAPDKALEKLLAYYHEILAAAEARSPHEAGEADLTFVSAVDNRRV